jgi:Domain of unknown function (DUF1871)
MSAHKVLFTHVRHIVNTYDPAGLSAEGELDDEYDPEVGRIVTLLRLESDRDVLASKIVAIFAQAFGTDIKPDNNIYRSIAGDLLTLKRRLQW